MASLPGVLLARDALPDPGQEPRVAWLSRLPAPKMLAGLLACDAIWAPAELHGPLEAMGLPAHRLTVPEDPVLLARDLVDRARPVDLVWRGPWGRVSSLAAVNSQLAGALEARGLRLLLQPPSSQPSELDCPAVTQSWPTDLLPASAGPLIAYGPWEYGAVPQQWYSAGPPAANRWWTPSEYARSGMIDSGLAGEWISVVPNGVDLDAFVPDGEPLVLPGAEGRTVFLFVGGTIFRKGVDLLMQAWEQAFAPDDDVLLVLKDFGSREHYVDQNALGHLKRWAAETAHAPALVVDNLLTAEQMPQLYRSADVGVFPYRGEGFCLPALESMACGRPIIYPEVGPTREYCRQGGWAVPASPVSVPPAEDVALHGPAVLHEVDVEDLAEALRVAGAEHATRGAAARVEAEVYGWPAAAERAERALAEIAGETPNHRRRPLRPEGRARVLACAPDWDGAAWQAPLTKALSELDANTTLALHTGHFSEADALARLLSALAAAGIDPETLAAEITLVETESWGSLALGCDGVLLLDRPARPWIGRVQLTADQTNS